MDTLKQSLKTTAVFGGVDLPDGPRFSVIIATYDRPKHLAEAIESVLRQTVQDLELIVVDDASPSAATVPSDSRVRLIRLHENAGVGHSRNVGLTAARGKFITFLDDDDLYHPDRLGVPDVPLSVCYRRDDHGITLYGRWAQQSPQIGQVTIRRDLCPPFDPGFARTEDVDWWLTVTQSLSVSPAIVERVGVTHRSGAPHQLTRVTGPHDLISGVLRLLNKHPEYFSSHRSAAALQWNRAWHWSRRTGHPLAALTYKVRALRAGIGSRLVNENVSAVRREEGPSTGRTSRSS
jgi:glycosyltransferase involved in cell wall biosynthesis